MISNTVTVGKFDLCTHAGDQNIQLIFLNGFINLSIQFDQKLDLNNPIFSTIWFPNASY